MKEKIEIDLPVKNAVRKKEVFEKNYKYRGKEVKERKNDTRTI